MARKPTPDILAAAGVDVLSAILTANLPPNADGEVEVDYPIDRIIVGKRLRQVGDITDLAASMRQVGQLQAITLLTDGTLVVGGHRLAAATSIGWTTIRARLRGMDAVDAELAEIDENLYRRELSVLEQAEHLHRRMELLEIRGQRAQAGDNQHTDGATATPTTTATIAGSMGLSERSAQQRLQIARTITQDARDRLRGTELADSTTRLLDLSRQPQQYQAAIVAELLANPALDVMRAARLVIPVVEAYKKTFDGGGFYAYVSAPNKGPGMKATDGFHFMEDTTAAFQRGEYSQAQLHSHLVRHSLAHQSDAIFDQDLRDAQFSDILTVWQWRTTQGDKKRTPCNRMAAKLRRLGYDAPDLQPEPSEAQTLAAMHEQYRAQQAATEPARSAALQSIGKPLVEWTDDDWAAYDAASRPAASPAQPEPQPEPPTQPIDPADWQVLQPIPPADDRNHRIDAVTQALSAALAALGDYEDLTGNYTHSWPLRRQITVMLETLEANRL